LAEGNRRADNLVAPAWAAPPPDKFAQARASHTFFHQSARMLHRQFGISESDARGIVQTCADCQPFIPNFKPGVSPRGHGPLEFWQTDVTHVREFGKLKFIHLSVDCYSTAIWATAQ
ncbi:POK6 protein, partial [Chroicocephalus maculipennis]|nr:POK6 protein [Chroicocephalus maculipennis]